MTDRPAPSPEIVMFRIRRWMVRNFELLSVVVMSLTAILTTWSGFQSARAWDLEADQKLWEIWATGLTTAPSAEFSQDETELVYEDANGVYRFTPLDTDEVVAQAKAAVTRGLTDDECRQYLHTDGCQN